MYWLDIAIICILVVCFIYNISKGFVRQLFSLGATILGAILATSYCGLGHKYLGQYIKFPNFNNILGFIIIFLGVVYLGSLAGRLVSNCIKSIGGSPTDRFFGGILGMIKGVIITSLGLLLITMFLDQGPKMIVRSRIAPFFNPITHQLSHLLPPTLRRQFRLRSNKIKHRPTSLEKALKRDKKKLEQIIEKNL